MVLTECMQLLQLAYLNVKGGSVCMPHPLIYELVLVVGFLNRL